GDDAVKIAVAVDDDNSLMAGELRIMSSDSLSQLADPHFGLDSRDLSIHHLRDNDLLQDIRFIVLWDHETTTSKLLGHDRSSRHKQHGDAIGDHADEHERQHRVVITGDLERENDECKSSA